MGRYGYQDMPEGWSDVRFTMVDARCVDCKRMFKAGIEETSIAYKEGEYAGPVAHCGCTEMEDRRVDLREELRAE